MKAINKSIIISGLALICTVPCFADPYPYSQNNLMGDGSNITIVGGLNCSGILCSENYFSLTGGYLSSNGLEGINKNGFLTIPSQMSNNQPSAPGGIMANAIISTYGVNFYTYNMTDEFSSTNFSSAQLNVQDNGVNIGIGQPQSGTSVGVSQQLGQPTVTLIQPAIQVGTGPLAYTSPPIYHIEINTSQSNAAEFPASASQNSNVASAPYFNAYNNQPFESGSYGTYVITPASIINDGSNNYRLGPQDFYYQGSLSQIGIFQNFNNLEIGGTNLTQYEMALPTQSQQGKLPPNPNFSIIITPKQATGTGAAEPIYANGMDQIPFTVQIQNNGQAIAPSDPNYGWLYNDLYFVDTDDNTLITNTAMNEGSLAVTPYCGPYPNAIGNANSNNSCTSPDSDDAVYYFSSSQAGTFNIAAVLGVDATSRKGTVDNITESTAIPFYAQAPLDTAPLSPTGWNQSNNTLMFNNPLELPTSSNEVVFLNANNPFLPVFVGFNLYQSVSSYNYDNTITSASSGVVSGTELQFGEFQGSVTNLATNAVDEYGNYYVTASYGN